jgi:hypothetical protein
MGGFTRKMMVKGLSATWTLNTQPAHGIWGLRVQLQFNRREGIEDWSKRALTLMKVPRNSMHYLWRQNILVVSFSKIYCGVPFWRFFYTTIYHLVLCIILHHLQPSWVVVSSASVQDKIFNFWWLLDVTKQAKQGMGVWVDQGEKKLNRSMELTNDTVGNTPEVASKSIYSFHCLFSLPVQLFAERHKLCA